MPVQAVDRLALLRQVRGNAHRNQNLARPTVFTTRASRSQRPRGHSARSGGQGAALETLHEPAAVSLHPGLLVGRLDQDATTLGQSARTMVAVRIILDDIRIKGEKAIVFAKTKEVPRALALYLCDLYGFRVDIVNGDAALPVEALHAWQGFMPSRLATASTSSSCRRWPWASG